AALTQYKWVRESNEGVGRIFDEMKDYFLDDPVYSEPNNSSVQLTLKNNVVARKERETGRVSNIITPELFESLNEQHELIVRHLYNQGELTASKIANIIQRSVPTARKRLKELEEMNIISTHGSSKNDPKRTYYLLGFE
ncbi:ATP-dependent DNA helicase RecG, partial [Staphylococcus pseudintermedius]